jgi:hypothetical protein
MRAVVHRAALSLSLSLLPMFSQSHLDLHRKAPMFPFAFQAQWLIETYGPHDCQLFDGLR